MTTTMGILSRGEGDFDIRRGDLTDPRVLALLETHLAGARANSPPCSVHALDVGGLQGPDLAFWTLWEADGLVGMGALKTLDAAHGEVKSMHTARAARGRGAAASCCATSSPRRGRGV